MVCYLIVVYLLYRTLHGHLFFNTRKETYLLYQSRDQKNLLKQSFKAPQVRKLNSVSID